MEVEEKNIGKWKLWCGWIEGKVFIFVGFESVWEVLLQMKPTTNIAAGAAEFSGDGDEFDGGFRDGGKFQWLRTSFSSSGSSCEALHYTLFLFLFLSIFSISRYIFNFYLFEGEVWLASLIKKNIKLVLSVFFGLLSAYVSC